MFAQNNQVILLVHPEAEAGLSCLGGEKKIKPLQLIVGVTVILANMAAGLIHKYTIIMSLLCLEKSPYRWESKGRPLNRHLGKQKGQLWLISFNVGQLFKPLH